MGLLDGGLSGVFAAAFGSFYLDGILHVPQVVSDGEGGYTRAFTPYPIKGQVDSYSDEYRARAGIPDTDARLIVLQHGAGAAPTTDSEITLRGVRYQVQPPIQQDPAQAAWTIRGRPVVPPPA